MDTIKEKIAKAQNSNEYITLSNYYKSKSYMQITGVSRLEMAHSSMIAWLLNPKAHSLGEYPLKKFLSLISVAYDRSKDCEAELSLELLLRFSCEDYSIYGIEKLITEFPIQNDVAKGIEKNRRIDILIESKLLIDGEYFTLPIIIENKVKSKEHDKQTESYYHWATQQYEGNEKYLPPIFVYLTPSKKDKPDCKYFIKIDYQDIIDYVLEPSIKRCKEDTTTYILKDYLRCLTFDDLMNDTCASVKGDVIMGYSSEEKQLLKKFWDNNKELLYAVANVIDDADEADKKTIQSLKDGLRKRDYTKYKYGDKIYDTKRGLVFAVVSDYIKNTPNKGYDEIKETFAGIVINQEEYDKRKSKSDFDQFVHNGETYYISNQIQAGGKKLFNINNFLIVAKNLEIEVEMC